MSKQTWLSLRMTSGDQGNRGQGGKDKSVGDQGSIELSHGGRNASQEGGYFAAEFVVRQLEGDEWRPSGNSTRRGSVELETKR